MAEDIHSLVDALSKAPSTSASKRTAEVRWFYEGAPPASAGAWFRSMVKGAPPTAERTDLYLVTGREDLSVKCREGRLEAKRRRSAGRNVALVGSVEGVVERWDKWVRPGLPDHLSERGMNGTDTLQVEKARQLVTFVMKDGETERPSSAPRRSCNVELTQLRVLEQLWWSICLEAIGPEPELEQVLLRTARHVFSQQPSLSLDAMHSCAYPDWLLRLNTLTR